MNLAEKKNILFKLGGILNHLGKNETWPGYDLGINSTEYDNLNELVKTVHHYNQWFTEAHVRQSFLGIASWLEKSTLESWLANYNLENAASKKVAIIMAGNIPLVGFHDFISVFLAGHKAIVKLSSEDNQLFPALIKTMALFDERILKNVEFADAPLKDFDAVIATGSNNSSRYFESYFGKYPHIIRKNRTSLAVLDGTETKEELQKLGRDIFDYYGLGCRSVSQVWIPQDFEINRLFEALYDYNEIVNHNKYANNYDYNKAVYLMNLEEILDNGFMILKENKSMHSPLAVLHYWRYNLASEVQEYLQSEKEQIQVVIGKGYLSFGESQCPRISDYADGVDTMSFLTGL